MLSIRLPSLTCLSSRTVPLRISTCFICSYLIHTPLAHILLDFIHFSCISEVMPRKKPAKRPRETATAPRGFEHTHEPHYQPDQHVKAPLSQTAQAWSSNDAQSTSRQEDDIRKRSSDIADILLRSECGGSAVCSFGLRNFWLQMLTCNLHVGHRLSRQKGLQPYRGYASHGIGQPRD